MNVAARQTVPTARQTAPAAQQTVPTAQQTIPTARQTFLAAQQSNPNHPTIVSSLSVYWQSAFLRFHLKNSHLFA